MISKEATRAYNLAMAEVQVVLASGRKFYCQELVGALVWVAIIVHTVPVTLARSFAVVVLAQPIELVGVWNPIRIGTNSVGCHLDMSAIGEDDAVMQCHWLAHNSVEPNCYMHQYPYQLLTAMQDSNRHRKITKENVD